MAKTVGESGRGRSQAVHRAVQRAILDQALAPYVSRVEMSRIGHISCSRMSYYTSLAAVAERRSATATEPEPSA